VTRIKNGRGNPARLTQILLGICFWREAPGTAVGLDRRAGEKGVDLPGGTPGKAAPRVKGATDAGPGLRRFIEDSRTEVRRCVWGLRARALDRRGIGAALQELARQHNAGAGPHLVVSESGKIRALDPASENHLFRFAQEAVGNALKHAAAKTILLSLEWGNEMLGLGIGDDGRGLPDGSTTPASLESRAAALSARMTVSTNVPSGTRVALEMDLAPHLSTHPPEA